MRRGHVARACGAFALAVLALLPGRGPAAESDAEPPSFFDAVVSISPGINRELDVLFDHVRAADSRLTQLSVRLQYPLLPQFQLALEVPALLSDPDGGKLRAGAGDIVLGAQALLWVPRDWPAEIDAGLELTLPTGDDRVLAGSTAVRLFAAAGVKLGPVDVLANASYQWGAAGPVAGVELLQTTLAVGYPSRWVTPFVELTLLKPVRGVEDPSPQVAVVPGLEVFLPGKASLSAGVQLPLGPQRLFDLRVLAVFKWPF